MVGKDIFNPMGSKNIFMVHVHKKFPLVPLPWLSLNHRINSGEWSYVYIIQHSKELVDIYFRYSWISF